MKSKTYEDFVQKFKPKRTTDDCFTPKEIYEAVKDWVVKEYKIDESKIIRPFWPGEDYQKIDYFDGCVVLDNPPFSILSKICEWYIDRNIRFFLFAPALTILSGKNICMRINHIICDLEVEYENGAKISTSFVTNLDENDYVLQTCPELSAKIKKVMREIKQNNKRQLPKYEYPDHIVTAAMAQKYCKYGISLNVKKTDCTFISALDSQKEKGKGIFGYGLLLSEKAAAEKAAAEKAAAEKAAAEVWELSERERAIISRLG